MNHASKGASRRVHMNFRVLTNSPSSRDRTHAVAPAVLELGMGTIPEDEQKLFV